MKYIYIWYFYMVYILYPMVVEPIAIGIPYLSQLVFLERQQRGCTHLFLD